MPAQTRISALAVAAVFMFATVPTPVARQASGENEIGWLGLFNASLAEWLENENRLEPLCSKFRKDSAEWHRCRAEKLSPQLRLIRLWHGPPEHAAPAGSLLVLATPGQGLRSFFVPTGGGAGTEFQPDLFDGDWGYGP